MKKNSRAVSLLLVLAVGLSVAGCTEAPSETSSESVQGTVSYVPLGDRAPLHPWEAPLTGSDYFYTQEELETVEWPDREAMDEVKSKLDDVGWIALEEAVSILGKGRCPTSGILTIEWCFSDGSTALFTPSHHPDTGIPILGKAPAQQLKEEWVLSDTEAAGEQKTTDEAIKRVVEILQGQGWISVEETVSLLGPCPEVISYKDSSSYEMRWTSDSGKWFVEAVRTHPDTKEPIFVKAP